jgi:NAD-dependent SIR2 family protein deacetylase
MRDLIATYGLSAEAISSAEALIIGTGAGMGVHSGLPDSRGTQSSCFSWSCGSTARALKSHQPFYQFAVAGLQPPQPQNPSTNSA